MAFTHFVKEETAYFSLQRKKKPAYIIYKIQSNLQEVGHIKKMVCKEMLVKCKQTKMKSTHGLYI